MSPPAPPDPPTKAGYPVTEPTVFPENGKTYLPPDYKKVAGWMAFFGPAGMPQAVVNRLSAEIMSTVQMPDVRSKLEDAGFTVIGNSPEQMAAAMKSDIEIFGRIARAAKIEPE